jgi:protein arginine kinase activator
LSVEEARVFADESPEWNIDLGGAVTCEMCGEEPATVHLLRVVDGTVNHTHLCPGCAETMAEGTDGLALVLVVPSALRHLGNSQAANAADAALPPVPSGDDELRFCAVCGTTLTDLKESGLVGCAKCYQIFAEYLEASFRGSAEPTEHLGKMPQRGPETDTLRHEIMRLERMLRELVAYERFEEAAGVRDRLAELGQKLEGGVA